MVTNRIYEYKIVYKNISIDRYDKRYGTIINNLYNNVQGYFYGTKKGDIFVLMTSDPTSFTTVTLLNDRYVYNVTNVSNIVSNSLSEMEEHQIDELLTEIKDRLAPYHDTNAMYLVLFPRLVH